MKNHEFEEFNLKPELERVVAELGFKHPTPIQQQVIPAALKNESIIGQSQTGSGKTHAFLLPLFNGKIAVPTVYKKGTSFYDEIASCIDANDEIRKTFPKGYQLFLKSQLFMLFYILIEKCSITVTEQKDGKSLEKLKLILKYIENHYMNKITIADAAAEVQLSQSHFMKYFKNTMGTSFTSYLNEYRLTMVSRLLISSESSILDIAAESGFDNLSYFNRMFKRRFGMTPREYRKKFTEN